MKEIEIYRERYRNMSEEKKERQKKSQKIYP